MNKFDGWFFVMHNLLLHWNRHPEFLGCNPVNRIIIDAAVFQVPENCTFMLRGLNPNIPLTILSAGSQLLLIAPCATAAVPVPSPSPSVTISVK